MKSFVPKKADLKNGFVTVDVSGMILGRACAKIAHVLRGKHKPIFMPGTNCGDHVIVLNSDQIKFTGEKMDRKILYKHTGYVGNMRELTLGFRMNRDSTEVIRTAVKRMLPRGPLGRHQLRMLHVYPDSNHKYASVKSKSMNEIGVVIS
jgi:large subunit ribosomal protein L13